MLFSSCCKAYVVAYDTSILKNCKNELLDAQRDVCIWAVLNRIFPWLEWEGNYLDITAP